MRIRVLTALGLFLLLASTACGGATTGGLGHRMHYGEDPQENYEGALLAYRHDNCIDAEPVFRRIRREFPYSRFAALSELRLADCKFKDGHFPEAITAYRRFVRLRPSHSQVPYARFRIAESHYEQIPKDWLLAPPSFERDQGSTREALRQLRRFVLDFPEDQRLPDARRMIDKCLGLLARHELYVARFYAHRDAWAGAAGRLRTLLATYAGSGLEPEALLLLGQVYLELNDRAQARQAFGELVERFPAAEEATDARAALRRLGPARQAPAPEPTPAS